MTKSLRIFLSCMCLFFCVHVQAQSLNSQDLLRVLDPLVDQTLAAYNSNDDVKFFQFFTQRSYDSTTPQYFKTVYSDGYKRELGDYDSRVLIEDKSSFDKYYPVMVYKAQFVKNKKVIVTVRFMNEHGFYRITSVDFDKVYFND